MSRPAKYQTAEDIELVIESYFQNNASKPTVTGLALHLGFTSRQAILNYEAKSEFVDAIKRAKLRIEQYYEEALFSKYTIGAIFALKNFGWSDKFEGEIKHNGGITVSLNLNGNKIRQALDAGIPNQDN